MTKLMGGFQARLISYGRTGGKEWIFRTLPTQARDLIIGLNDNDDSKDYDILKNMTRSTTQ